VGSVKVTSPAGLSRVCDVLSAVEVTGVADDTAVVVVADYGMEQSDSDQGEPWDEALAATGVPYREVGDGLIDLVD
jgi:hypothetical protein